ncbi:MAG: hypothetical protein WB791_01675 [Waddliaceae bacterium]
MNITKNIGMLLLSAYLILLGITALIGGFSIPPMILGGLSLAAGIFILIGK